LNHINADSGIPFDSSRTDSALAQIPIAARQEDFASELKKLGLAFGGSALIGMALDAREIDPPSAAPAQ
jgi:hypothetical protein